ncbi:MAG TPA: hypothetical protein VF952_04795 [Chloroflexia bacterium]|jgi:hypothetical protein
MVTQTSVPNATVLAQKLNYPTQDAIRRYYDLSSPPRPSPIDLHMSKWIEAHPLVRLLMYLGVLSLIGLPFVIMVYKAIENNLEAAHSRELEQWKADVAEHERFVQSKANRISSNWDELYYCSRDYVVFLPGTAVVASPERAIDLF